jgi:hypothetical protein
MVKKININYKELQNMSPSEYFKKYNIVDKAEKRKIYREAKKLKEQSNPKEKIVNKEKEIKTEKIEIDNSTQNDSKSQINKSGFEVGKIESSEEAQSISNIFKGIDSEGNATNENQTSSNDSSSTFSDVNDETSDSSGSSSSSKNKYADEQAIDVEGLAKIVPSTLNLVFKKYGVKELSEEESENMKEKSKVVIAKRAPAFISSYYDLIDLGIVAGPIVLDRVGQYQDIYKKVQEKKKQDEQAKAREAEQKAQAQQQANQQASQPKPASVAHKPSTSERINPNSPYYDFEYFKKWQKYAMGEGPKPEED